MIQEAHGDGRLDFEEMDERLTQIYSAKTQLELRTATADLVPVAHGSDSAELTIRAKHSGQKREGTWQVPERIDAVAEHSRVKLDFTDAVVRWPEIHVEARPKHSSVVMIVPEGWSDRPSTRSTWCDSSCQEQGRYSESRVASGSASPARPATAAIVVRHPRKRHWWWPWYRK